MHPDAEGAAILAKTVYSAITGDYGGLAMSPVYTDNMVLQRDEPLLIQGIADAGEKVTVAVNGVKAVATAANDGKWHVTLPPMKAGGPYELMISTPSRSLKYSDVLVGEVWPAPDSRIWNLCCASRLQLPAMTADALTISCVCTT